MAYDTEESLLYEAGLYPSSLSVQQARSAKQADPCSTAGPRFRDPALPFVTVYSDGGQYSAEYCCSNMLADDSSCYCTKKREGVNVVLTLKSCAAFTISQVNIRAPREGYTSPLGQGLIFISWDPPDITATQQYDDVRSCSDYQQLLRRKVVQAGGLDEHDPVLFFDLGDYYSTAIEFDVPRSGRYVLIKLLRPRNHGENVDVQYMGLHGWLGCRAFAAGDMC